MMDKETPSDATEKKVSGPRYQFDKAVDLSHDMENGMKFYPNRTHVSPLFEVGYSTLAKDGVNVTKITMGSHTGTHIDA